MKTLLTILSLILLAGTSWGQTKPVDPTIVWIIVGAGGAGVTCDSSGCDRPDVYWTGTDNSYADYLPKGWSLNWKDAKQYRIEDDPDRAVPNGRHCCYAENVTSIDPKTPQTKPETSKAADNERHMVQCANGVWTVPEACDCCGGLAADAPDVDTRICWDRKSPAGPTKDDEANCKQWGGDWIHVCETYDSKMNDFPVVPCFPTPEKAASTAVTAWIGCINLSAGIPCKDDPIDASPIQEEYGNLGYSWCDITCSFVESDKPPFPDTKLYRRTRATCADKTRFLMTAEDGSKHCIALLPDLKKK